MKTIKNPLLLISCILICVYKTSVAQDYGTPPQPAYNQAGQDPDVATPSGYISINFGFANPEGSFASAVGSNYGGYALPGDVFHLSLGIPINHSNFGVAFMFSTYNNIYDNNTYANNNGDYSLPANNIYSESAIMGGFYVTYPAGIFSFDGRLMLGALLNSFPEQDYGYNDAAGDEYQYDLQSSNSTSLAFDAGIGARCLIAQFWRRKLCFMVNVDYLYSNAPYNTEQDVYEFPVTGPNAGYQIQLVPSPTFSGNIPIELLNITFGLGYQL